MAAPLVLRTPGPSPQRRSVLTRRVRLLVAATITDNVIEAVVAITVGAAASSTALIGFGLDSVIEVSSAAAVLLVGLGVNSLFGWWWADPVAALVIAAVAVKEGREAWRGDACCAPTAAAPRPAAAEPAGGCADGCCAADEHGARLAGARDGTEMDA